MVGVEEAAAAAAAAAEAVVWDRIDQHTVAEEEADTDEMDGYEGKVEGKMESARPSKLGRMRRGA